MAGGIDWFRWHHGSVTDPKFQLVARRASASVAEVVAVWAMLLESASQADDRGCVESYDPEAIDCALGLVDGKTDAIVQAMRDRGLLNDAARITAWDKRQPKREDDTAAERKRRQRERDAQSVTHVHDASRDVTQSHAQSREVTVCHDRGEESREEENTHTHAHSPCGERVCVQDRRPAQAAICATAPPKPRRRRSQATADAAAALGFERFWAVYPRRENRERAEREWVKLQPDEELVERIVQAVQAAARREQWQADDGRYVPHPSTWLNNRRWTDEKVAPARSGQLAVQWWLAQGYGSEAMALLDGVKPPRECVQ